MAITPIGDSALETNGFARYGAADIVPGLDAAQTQALLAPLTECYRDLPADPSAPTEGRYRRYAAGVVLPWTRAVHWMPGCADAEYGSVAHFEQGQHNPEYPGTSRRFPYIDDETLDNQLLRHLILYDLDQLPWTGAGSHPVHIGVHLVNLACTGESAAYSSPNCLHQDGGTVSVYFVHLLARVNAVGGETVIATPDSSGRSVTGLPDTMTRARFTLELPLDSYAVIDSRVSHYVGPIRPADQHGTAQRSAILIGLTPYRRCP